MPDSSLPVGLGEIKVSREPDVVLVAYGLGSCVGVGVYDPVAHVAGLLHAVLPERTNGTDVLSPKYVDSGIRALLKEMEQAGAVRRHLIIRIAGGANMLQAPGFKQTFNIGDRNVAATRATLATLGLPLRAEAVGGQTGRTVRLLVASGRMTVRVLGTGEIEL
jgi:chemotaxis protein CheD